MSCKIKIKFGSIEIDFEGEEDYLKNDLPSLIELLTSYVPQIEEDPEEEEILNENPDPSKKKFQFTTNTIASKLNVKSGPDLAIAACAHLTFVKGADSFHRKNILAEMKSASNYYKISHSKNLSQSLKYLVKENKIIERSLDNYALEANTKNDLEAKLG